MIKKSDTVKEMVSSLEYQAKINNIDLHNNIPNDVNKLDYLFNDGGEIRCVYFVDLADEYCLQFGNIEDYNVKNGFQSHVDSCIESAMSILQKKYNNKK